jgi:hypothetical protein
MRLTIYFNQARMIEWGLNPNHAALVCALNQAHTWAEASVIDGKMFFWVSRKRVMDELPGFFTKSDTVYRAFRHLADKGLIEYIKQGDRDMIHLTEKFKKWNVAPRSEINPNLGNEPEPRNEIRKSSEIKPNYLGNESDILDTTGLDTSGLDLPPSGVSARATADDDQPKFSDPPPEPSPPAKSKRQSREEAFVAFVVERGVDEETARCWWQYRDGKPMTSKAWERHCAQAEAAGITPQAAADYTAGREWRAFYADGYLREMADTELARRQSAPIPQGRVFDQQGNPQGMTSGMPARFGNVPPMPAGRTSKMSQGLAALEEMKAKIDRGEI